MHRYIHTYVYDIYIYIYIYTLYMHTYIMYICVHTYKSINIYTLGSAAPARGWPAAHRACPRKARQLP